MPLSDRRLASTDPLPVEESEAPRAPAAARKKAKTEDKPKPVVKTADKLAKLGLKSDIDLVLHLPMRYEDETQLTPIGELIPGDIAQTEGVVFDNEIAYRPRRQLLVKIHDEAGDELTLRFLNFYGSQVKQMAIGVRLRVRGDVRGGFFGLEMVHPAVRPVDEDTPLPQALTPVYPSTAGVSQAYLRKAIDSAISRVSLPELLPEPIAHAYLKPLDVPGLLDAVKTLHHPRADSDETALIDGTHPAWTRIKFEELLAQQLSLKRAHEERRTRAAPAMPRRLAGDEQSLVVRLLQALPFALTGAQQRVVAEIAGSSRSRIRCSVSYRAMSAAARPSSRRSRRRRPSTPVIRPRSWRRPKSSRNSTRASCAAGWSRSACRSRGSRAVSRRRRSAPRSKRPRSARRNWSSARTRSFRMRWSSRAWVS